MISGLRVHITGSAATDCDRDLLHAAHQYVHSLTDELIARGGGLVLGAGGEPIGSAGLPCTFDWTALERIAAADSPAPAWPAARSHRFAVVASQRSLEQLPAARLNEWQRCTSRPDFDLELSPPGWRMAGILRERQARRGDILLVLGGGAGGEHLAQLYQDDGKPVVPVHTALGSNSQDGSGGSQYLHERALADTDSFARLRDGAGSATARLRELRLTKDTDTQHLAAQTADLLDDLRPRTAFYVRLLDTEDPEFESVEQFFREVVDPVITKRGFTPYEIGGGPPETAFMNVEIFQGIHLAGIVIVDLTGVRPNCMMELGYALGRRRRYVISAKKGTELPFDPDKLPIYFWSDPNTSGAVNAYQDWFDRHSEMPPIVPARHFIE